MTTTHDNTNKTLKELYDELFEFVSFIESVDVGTCPEDRWPTVAEYNTAVRAHGALSSKLLALETA